jgi:outer membrane protein TolC
MTPEERWIIEGRTREDFRKTKTAVGLLKADIAAHAERLQEAHHHLTAFLAAPSDQPGPTGMTPAQYLTHFFRDFVPTEIESKVQELATAAKRLQALEKQIAEFD